MRGGQAPGKASTSLMIHNHFTPFSFSPSSYRLPASFRSMPMSDACCAHNRRRTLRVSAPLCCPVPRILIGRTLSTQPLIGFLGSSPDREWRVVNDAYSNTGVPCATAARRPSRLCSLLGAPWPLSTYSVGNRYESTHDNSAQAHKR